MRTNRELKRIARENLIGNFRIPMGAFIFSQLLSSLLMIPFTQNLPAKPTPVQYGVYIAASLIILVLTTTLLIGELWLHLSMARKQPIAVGMIFYGFRNHPDRFIIGSFISLLCSGIWLVPGVILSRIALRDYSVEYALYALGALAVGGFVSIIISLRIAFFVYLLLDYPNATVKECFFHSSEMLNGYKGKLFGMACSFIGMVFLGAVSFGIGLFWVEPYMNQSFTLFYLEVKGELSSIEEAPASKVEPTFDQYV